MEKLICNITSLYHQKGKQWLEELGNLKKELSQYWNLTNIRPVKNMTYNFVAKATKDKSFGVVLKIGFDPINIESEARALEHFDGNGFIKLLDRRLDKGALLLEEAMPASPLEGIDGYIDIITKIRARPVVRNFDHVSDWLQAIERCRSDQIPKEYLDRAIELKTKLLKSSAQEYTLHGDLHIENIVSHKQGFVAIDPKGVNGPIEFEVAKYDHIDRLKELASRLDLNIQTLYDWFFVRNVLAACWAIEDNQDPTPFLQKVHL